MELKSLSAVAREANEQGFRSKRRIEKEGIRGEKLFNSTTVRGILTNWIYIGILEEHKRNKGKPDSEVPKDQRYSTHVPPNPDDWPHIVDDATFDAVQAILAQNEGLKKPSSHKTYSYILTGIVHCALCNNPMVVEKGKDHRYYACQNRDCSGRKLIPKKFHRRKRNTIDAPSLDDSMKRLIKDVVLKSPEDIHEITKQANEYICDSIPNLTEQIRALKTRKDNMLAEKRGILVALSRAEEDQVVSEGLTRDLRAISDDLKDVDKSISQISSELEQAKQNQVTEAAIRRALEVYVMSLEGVNDQTQKELTQMFFDSVRVGVEEIEAHLRLDEILYLARVGPDPDKFDWSKGWYARQDSNPEPSGP